MEMYVIITLVAIGLFILANVYRLHRKAQKELARKNFGTLAKQKRTLKEAVMKNEKPKPNIIRVNGPKPIALNNDTPLVWGASVSFGREETRA